MSFLTTAFLLVLVLWNGTVVVNGDLDSVWDGSGRIYFKVGYLPQNLSVGIEVKHVKPYSE